MHLSWAAEPSPRWDADKQRVVGAWPALFPVLCRAHDGATLPGRWWRADGDGRALGYGWMDVTWGDAEVWLAVSPEMSGRGVGSYVMAHLMREARGQGLRYMYNALPDKHPEPKRLQQWLERRGFHLSGDGLLKLAV